MSTYLHMSSYLCLPAYLFPPTYLLISTYLLITTYLCLCTYGYLPMSTYEPLLVFFFMLFGFLCCYCVSKQLKLPVKHKKLPNLVQVSEKINFKCQINLFSKWNNIKELHGTNRQKGGVIMEGGEPIKGLTLS